MVRIALAVEVHVSGVLGRGSLLAATVLAALIIARAVNVL
jgi:hypothetical protein